MRSHVNAALLQGRLPQALEFAKHLVSQAPTDENRELLRRVYLDGIRQEIDRNMAVDARRWLDEAEIVDGPGPIWWESLAVLRAKLGDCDRARKLLENAPGSDLLPRLLAFQVDHAMADRQRGRDLVPHDLRPGFDLIRQAFAEYDRGQDDAARQTLQGIGLQSPYLEWKLLLRGLMAWSTNDNSRALENWLRLDPERLPARLTAPFRFLTDPAFRNNLKPEHASAMSRRADQIAHPILSSLRDLQRSLGASRGLPRALKQIPALLGLLRTSFPQQAQKLANCVYWMILQDGEASDLDRYEKLFGKPADDPEFFRMRALVMEGLNSLDEAHHFWKKYADWIEATPERWPGEQGRRARAMILMRMGDNARKHLEHNGEPSFTDFLDMLSGGRPPRGLPSQRPLQPPAERCYKRAMELAPDWKEPAAKLMNLLEESEEWEAAEAVGRKILKESPDDVPTLVAVSGIQHELGKTDEALASLKEALKNNPLDRALRMGVALLTLEHGRSLALTKKFEAARQALAEAAVHAETAATAGGVLPSIVKAAMAACEFKANDLERARQLEAEAVITKNFGPASFYEIFVECSRIKVDKPTLKQFQARLDEALQQQGTVPEVINLLLVLHIYKGEPHRYRGIGPHEKKIVARAALALKGDATEDELCHLGAVLRGHKMSKILKTCADRGMTGFPENPYFRFLLGEHLIMQRPQSFNVRHVGALFRDVLRMSEGKQDERSRAMREQIEERKKEYPEIEDWMAPAETWW
jgi:tetratricopeptide (TPR) repeat protein